MFDQSMRLLAGLAAIKPAGSLHPDLGTLFDELRACGDAKAAAGFEKRIWRAWGWHASAGARDELARASNLMTQGDGRAAREQLDALIERYPDFAECWNKRATLHFVEGRLGPSIADVHRVLELEPRHFGALAGLGQIFMHLSRPDLAEASLDAALRINPHMGGVAEMLATLRASEERRLQ